MIDFIDKTSEQSGTPINRENMMALQGFAARTITFNEYGVIETNSKGERLITSFRADGSVLEQFAGQKAISKTTTFNSDGSITEVIS